MTLNSRYSDGFYGSGSIVVIREMAPTYGMVRVIAMFLRTTG